MKKSGFEHREFLKSIIDRLSKIIASKQKQREQRQIIGDLTAAKNCLVAILDGKESSPSNSQKEAAYHLEKHIEDEAVSQMVGWIGELKEPLEPERKDFETYEQYLDAVEDWRLEMESFYPGETIMTEREARLYEEKQARLENLELIDYYENCGAYGMAEDIRGCWR